MAADRPRLPHLIIGGAPRSGTTALCHLLSRHPGIYVANPFIPEPKVCMFDHEHGAAGHRANYNSLFSNAPAGAVLVEKTSYYLENAEALARLIKAVPDTRFLFILREPAARAISNYWWTRKNGLEPLPLEEAFDTEFTRESPFSGDRRYIRPYDYQTRGFYDEFAEKYLAAFPGGRVRFVLFERLAADIDALSKELQEYAGVEVHCLGTIDEKINPSHATDLVSEEVWSKLRTLFAPHVARFADLTGVDVSSWGYASSRTPLEA